jgi:hypothetical protein
MAVVNVFIDAPFATEIVVDEKMPVISFIAQVSTDSFEKWQQVQIFEEKKLLQ